MEVKELVEKIRRGEIDCNNQELFFSILLKGLMLSLNNIIKIRDIEVPHLMIHTGDDGMYLHEKGQDMSIEPLEVSNEDYVYQTIPNCIVSPGSVEVVADQMTNPYALGQIQMEYDNGLYTLCGEFRRLPVKMSVGLKYQVSTYRDSLELIQQLLTKLSWIRTYPITYLGQRIVCSYTLPTSFSEEHLLDMDGTTMDNKNRIISLDLEVETNLPVVSERTVMATDKVIILTGGYGITPKEMKDLYSPDKLHNNRNSNSDYDGSEKREGSGYGIYNRDGIEKGENPTDKINLKSE